MILVLNCGSQSIKWKLFSIIDGVSPQTEKELKLAKSDKAEVLDSRQYKNILREELKKVSGEHISLIGHRVVHGDKIFIRPTKITEENLGDLEKLNDLAPLHNPYNVLGIKECLNTFKGRLNVAVFDTEFFSALSEKSYTYALPENLRQEFGFRRYGFHGTSHEYVAKKAAEILKKPLNKLKIISCHLGGGASIAAIKKGVAVDTSMGFTPMEGLVMMTRSGNVDAGIVLELARKFSPKTALEILNKESGLKGICGEDEMLKVLERVKAGDKKAKLALDVFIYSIQKYIGAYFAILGGCDVLVFTGSIGYGSAKIRNMICHKLDILKKTKKLAVDTDEELAIAQKIIKIF